VAISVPQSKGARATSGSVSVTLTSTPTAGNYLIICFANNSTSAQTTPTGYSLLQAANVGASTQVITWIKQAGAGESTTITYTPANGTSWEMIVLEVAGMTTPTVDKAATASSGTTSVLTLSTGPTAALTSPGDLVLGLTGTNVNPGTWTGTSGYSALGAYASQRLYVEYAIDSNQSAKTIAPTWTTSGRGVGQVIAISGGASSTGAFLAFM
jgi:hypothetical protein